MSGNVTVYLNRDFEPVGMPIVGNITTSTEKLGVREIEANVSEECDVPDWVLELKEQLGG
ncbi:hypothetical protein [Thermococcus sp. ES12]|uniref:hypothetical protein n=1 Tax=Thermococcus sp. ES12 TaxID=1638246 RepID=UPI00142FDB21|nr:hypothetical protein [Thermococcus sp. ES12]NJE75539.1 hypothetical protein [Thermococcus sp. ES12]